jgi:hypothetical protein
VSDPLQTGAVLVFKPSVSPEQAAEVLKALHYLLEYVPRVNEFNPEWGGPVWYVP